jgi:hypothetical protein
VCELAELEKGLWGEIRPPDIVIPLVCCSVDAFEVNVPATGPPEPS